MTTAEDFERDRPYLTRLAYRMLGSVTEAEDIVQQAFLRWLSAGEPHLETPRAWFTRTCTRLCLDRLKSGQWTREAYVGEWLPEPILEPHSARQEIDESLSMALLLTVQRLRPSERAVFLLHDVFGYAFNEVAEILELNPANCRQLAVRARRHLGGERGRASADRDTVERLSRVFFEAIGTGDLSSLQSVLAEDVVLRADGGGKVAAARRPITGANDVARFLHGVFSKPTPKPDVTPRAFWFNGAPGAVLYDRARPVSAFHFQVEAGRIQGIYVQRNPDKLQAFETAVDGRDEENLVPGDTTRRSPAHE